MTQDNENMKHEQYLQDRKIYVDGGREQQTLFDKTIVTFSGGATALIFTATKGIINSCILKASIFFFSLAVISVILSFFFSVKVHADFLEQFDDNYSNDEIGKVITSKFLKYVNKMNICSVLFSSLGALTFLFYVLSGNS